LIALLVGIDTEGDNQWSAESRLHPTYENIYALPRLHDLFRRHGVRPTYLVTHPVVRDERAADVLRRLHDSATCEIGAHHHAWETPPCTDEDVRRHVYALDLPLHRFEAQLQSLTTAIEVAVARRPTSYRSGRFGFAASHVAPLERCGYQVDSSVAPLFCETHKGGPDFAEAPLSPYSLDYDHPTRPGRSRILELPISCALSRRLPRRAELLWARAPRPYTTKRVLRALGIVRPIWLRPSYSSLDDMTALARRLAGDQVPLLNVVFHSSEAIVGGSPYNRTQAQLDAFFSRLEAFLAFAVGTLRAIPQTFAEFGAAYRRLAA
jgi:peptidoglycan/xylan/chitin deacetylase (PgdA/CDA1 family)